MNRMLFSKTMAKEYLLAIFSAVVVASIVRMFFFEAYRIPTPIMSPSLIPGDLIFVSKWDFGINLPGIGLSLGKPKMPDYGDVVIYAGNETQNVHFIKRVVGLPGDKISLKSGHLVLNSKTLDFKANETTICGNEIHPNKTYQICLEPPLLNDVPETQIPENQVFVIGDLRSQTASAVPWEVISIQLIRARASWIWLSIVQKTGREQMSLLPGFRFERMFRRVN